MAIAYMTRANILGYKEQNNLDRWEYDETLAAASNGDTVITPTNVTYLCLTLDIATGAGKVQTTTNKIADVLSDTDVVWVDWSNGEVSTTVQDTAYPVTAFRMVNVSGTTRIMAIAH